MDIGDGVNTDGEERIEEGVAAVGVGVNTTARFGIDEGVIGTVDSGGTTRTVGCYFKNWLILCCFRLSSEIP